MDIQAIDDAAFAGMIAEERLARALPKLYNGYFDGHIIFTEKWPEIEAGTMPNAVKTSVLEAFFTENLDNKILALQQDIETLKAIDLGNVDTKTFDFDGQKHSKDEAAEIQTVLAKELENTLKLRDRRDAEVAAAFYGLALSAGTAPAEKLKNAYRDLQEVAQCRKIFLLHASDILVTVHHIAQNGYNLATDMAQQFRELYNYHVPHLQEMFQKMPSLKLFPEALEKEIREVFLEPGLEFHTYNKPHAKNLERLQALIFETGAFLDQNTFDKQKAVLVMQDGMLANQH